MMDDAERIKKLILELTRLKELGKLSEQGNKALKELLQLDKIPKK